MFCQSHKPNNKHSKQAVRNTASKLYVLLFEKCFSRRYYVWSSNPFSLMQSSRTTLCISNGKRKGRRRALHEQTTSSTSGGGRRRRRRRCRDCDVCCALTMRLIVTTCVAFGITAVSEGKNRDNVPANQRRGESVVHNHCIRPGLQQVCDHRL